jgi:hypothetical protein
VIYSSCKVSTRHPVGSVKVVLVISVAVVARHDNARITDLHLGPRTLGEGFDAEQTVAPIRGENGEEI